MEGWSQSCLCGWIFTHTYAYTNHSHNCKKTKTRLSFALEKDKERYYAIKHHKMEVTQSEATGSPTMEVIQAEASGSPLLASAFLVNDVPSPDSTKNVGSSA
jgi:hypothetical protein